MEVEGSVLEGEFEHMGTLNKTLHEIPCTVSKLI